MTQLERYSDY
uniref:Uncharacterized protein n=1 Tax=Arundo donax TaxID=35708 RepID=A0A0A9HKF5_ARUDO